MRRTLWFGTLLLGLIACASNIREQYNKERDQVLATVGPAPAGWRGDIQIRIQPSSMQRLATAALDAGLLSWDKTIRVDAPLGVKIRLNPNASITRLRLLPGQGCTSCLNIDADLNGNATWVVGPLDGTLPFTARMKGDLALALKRTDDGFQLNGRLADISRLAVQSDSIKRVNVGPQIKRWAQNALDAAPAFTIADFGGDDLPLRAARINLSSEMLSVEALSMAEGAPVAASTALLDSGNDWEVRTSTETALNLMRRAAFEAGAQTYDLAVDPRALAVDGDRFDLNIRLWRLSNRGWWREYAVNGTFDVEKNKIQMHADRATQGEHSRGAGVADAIAVLARNRILEAITDNLQQAIPGTKSTTVQDLKIKAQTKSFTGEDGALVLQGTLTTQKVR
ncbi:MAG: hypothetical protein AAFV53_02820 [Myxococcota bacterium]